jgi:hypothetical protein
MVEKLKTYLVQKKDLHKTYYQQIKNLYKSRFKERPIFTQIFFVCIMVSDYFSIKTPSDRLEYRIRFREGETESQEDLKKSNRLDAWIILIILFWVAVVWLPEGSHFSFIPYVICAAGIYRLWDMFIQRFRSIFIDPYFFVNDNNKKPEHIIDLSRSLILAGLNFLEIVLIFSAFYKYLPPGSFNSPLEGFDSFYFSFVTITTLGYGDITPCPSALKAKVLITAELVLGLTWIIIVLGTIVTVLTERYGGERRTE